MSQKLILPINKAKLTASIDTEAYKKAFGFRHFGSDMISTQKDRTVYASGNGTVAATGWDNACGNVVAVVYPGAYNRKTQKDESIAIRYFHLAAINVKMGQRVDKNTKLGTYGMTGKYGGTGPHLHMEADADTQYVLYTPTVTASNYLRGTSQGAVPFDDARNTVMNVIDFMHCKPGLLDLQTYTTALDAYIHPEDRSIDKT
ncbi:MAG: M23 family metallopeptidase [Oscillospiraceae bacterium]|jgi:murein DD-endopeptidase MepM/ murein hydrolase activator NlpD|nr:M23 family metallopeptidase [Oscillospiraceae bacterium]